MYLDHFELALLWSRVPGLNHTRHLSLLGGPFVISAGLLAGRGFLVVLRPEAIRARRILAGTLLILAALSLPFLLLATRFSWHLAGPAVLGMAIFALVLRMRGDGLAARKPGSLAALMALWADEEEIACVHPGGGRVVGAAAIRASFEGIFANGGIPVQTEQVHRLQDQIEQIEAAAHHRNGNGNGPRPA
jgi:hypothetical protein